MINLIIRQQVLDAAVLVDRLARKGLTCPLRTAPLQPSFFGISATPLTAASFALASASPLVVFPALASAPDWVSL
jgi:hypothetical protein